MNTAEHSLVELGGIPSTSAFAQKRAAAGLFTPMVYATKRVGICLPLMPMKHLRHSMDLTTAVKLGTVLSFNSKTGAVVPFCKRLYLLFGRETPLG